MYSLYAYFIVITDQLYQCPVYDAHSCSYDAHSCSCNCVWLLCNGLRVGLRL